MWFLEYSFSGYLIGRHGSSGIHPILHSLAATQQSRRPRRVEARRQGAIDGGGEAIRAQATHGDQEDHSHPLLRACPDRSNRISQPRQKGEGPYSRSKVSTHPRNEEEGLRGGVT
jgi:hypothetical protein